MKRGKVLNAGLEIAVFLILVYIFRLIKWSYRLGVCVLVFLFVFDTIFIEHVIAQRDVLIIDTPFWEITSYLTFVMLVFCINSLSTKERCI